MEVAHRGNGWSAFGPVWPEYPASGAVSRIGSLWIGGPRKGGALSGPGARCFLGGEARRITAVRSVGVNGVKGRGGSATRFGAPPLPPAAIFATEKKQ